MAEKKIAIVRFEIELCLMVEPELLMMYTVSLSFIVELNRYPVISFLNRLIQIQVVFYE